MVIFKFTGGGVQQTHPQKGFCCCAEGLPVKEIAPAAQCLTDEKAQRHHIQGGKQADLLDPAVDDHTQCRADHAAVNCQTALADIKQGKQVVFIAVPREDAVIRPGANDRHRQDPQNAVQDIILFQSELLTSFQRIHNCQHHPKGDNKGIVIDGKRTDLDPSARIPLDTQARKGNGGIFHYSSSFLG